MKKHVCTFDVLNECGEKVGEKTISAFEKGQYLNDWFKRPKRTVLAVPLS